MTSSDMIRVTLNGQGREFASSASLRTVLESLGVADASHIAVALNGEVKRKDELAAIQLSDGDSVEIVRAVGGG
jgi:thiamine biosynthesis protein ThiS